MALYSPGTEITVINQSQYSPSNAGSIPYILLVTAQDKESGTGTGVALGTTSAYANKVVPISSQRELVTLYGTPTFYKNSTGSVIQGHELNEYGLLTAYNALGVSNRVFVQRADIDLSELVGTSVRPTKAPADGTLWFDLENTDFGLFEWNKSTQAFEKIEPIVIDDVSNTSGGFPLSSIGTIGSYAVVTTSTSNPVYHKKYDGSWVLVGSSAWTSNNPAVIGTETNPTLTAGNTIVINTTTVTLVTGTSVDDAITDINNAAITGITARNVGGKIAIHVSDTAQSNGTVTDGIMVIADGVGTPLSDLGIVAGSYASPDMALSPHTSVPEWKTTDSIPRPTGSVWSKTTSANFGADFKVYRYNATVDEWQSVAAPLYANDAEANKFLDAVGGGAGISAGSMYVRYDTLESGIATYTIKERKVTGKTTVKGANTSPTFTVNDQFTIQMSQRGLSTYTAPVAITLSGTTANDFVADVLAAAIPNLTATVEANGAVSLTHTLGGVMVLKNLVGVPLTDAGISSNTQYVTAGNNSDLIVSNWQTATYSASTTAPSVDPEDGTYWYFADVNDIDIMIHDGTAWRGYLNGGIDSRGYDLSLTDPAGPIVSASEPVSQSDGTPIVFGDLWVDTSDLENYPKIYRWSNLGGGLTGWVLIDNSDQTSEDGIVFADARWDTDGTTDVITGEFPSIVEMLTSDYVDLDAPEPDLYPRGTLLFNMRRSGFSVKQYVVDYFNANTFAGTLPAETSTWKTASGLQSDGSPYMGDNAVRAIIVAAMSSSIDSNLEVREEQNVFNLMVAPGYPELMDNLVSLNNDRKNTAFVIGDSPMTLKASSLEIQNWASNAALADSTGNKGLTTFDDYLAVYYPAGLTTDLDGNSVVMPSSYMALRTMIRSDNVSYPWFAPAGIRRGLVDNASSIGYIDSETGEYNTVGIGEGLRDVLYTQSINPISYIQGSGVTVYGQKTRSGSGLTAIDRVNVARLVAHIRYSLAIIAKPFVFEPNDKLTRDEIKQSIEKFFNDLVAKRALNDYVVVCDTTNNTPERIDRNELYVDIGIEPIKAIEFIYIPIRLLNTGEISGQ